MILSICTISFRHQLVSIDHLAKWAKHNHFQGIELWGTHAKNLASQPEYNKDWLADYGLKITMLSDYLALYATEAELHKQVEHLCYLAKHWGAKKIRTFAGSEASANTSEHGFARLTKTLRKVCQWMSRHDLNLIIETHPNTYADSVPATKHLLQSVACDNLQINFDVLHVWESKTEVIPAFEALKDNINHIHLKNVSSAEFLNVFSPANVYSASGSREGIVPLFDGAVNYQEFVSHISQHPDKRVRNIEASLEWFGNDCKETLARDRYLIQQLQQCREPLAI
ncbi:sugar phosphate isomerase/epimerase family protein [Microbulbifer sp. ZKSA004]|uniref:sugar phosphate isomerase/epimerase family protein n=1 Tax=Microbulbifer sp. ZKSA004 TaxID=3243389 RepID=UPI00403A2226